MLRNVYPFALLTFGVAIAGVTGAQATDFNLDLPDHPVAARAALTAGTPANTRRTYAELEGPGCIRHIWMTDSRSDTDLRNAILRIYFDGEEVPYVEAPLRDFFGVMHGKAWYPINTPFLSVQAKSGYNCYFPMPFAKSARIEVEAGPNGHYIYLQADWHRYPDQEMKEKRRFAARWRREFPTERYGQDYLMLDADGPGQLIGFVYGLRLIDNTDRWSHGGADNIYIDGMGAQPAYLRGIGGEDSFGTSYGGSLHTPRTHLNAGMPYYEQIDDGTARPSKNITGYRWFINDTIPFQESIQVRFGCMENDICSTVYWYQEGPVRPFFDMPSADRRIANQKDNELPRGTFDMPIPSSGTWRTFGGPMSNKDGEALFPRVASLMAGIAEEPDDVLVVEAQHGFVDLGHIWRPEVPGVGVYHRDVVGVLRTILRAPRDMEATLQLAWDDHLVLRLNDEETIDMGEKKNFGKATKTVMLHEGDNHIEVRLSNTQGFSHGAWAFAFKATGANGELLLPEAE